MVNPLSIIDQKQNKAIGIIAVSIGILAGFVTILAYMHERKHAQLKEDNLKLDNEIKQLELAQKKKEANKS